MTLFKSQKLDFEQENTLEMRTKGLKVDFAKNAYLRVLKYRELSFFMKKKRSDLPIRIYTLIFQKLLILTLIQLIARIESENYLESKRLTLVNTNKNQ